MYDNSVICGLLHLIAVANGSLHWLSALRPLLRPVSALPLPSVLSPQLLSLPALLEVWWLLIVTLGVV
jgi:hypothetical protein